MSYWKLKRLASVQQTIGQIRSAILKSTIKLNAQRRRIRQCLTKWHLTFTLVSDSSRSVYAALQLSKFSLIIRRHTRATTTARAMDTSSRMNRDEDELTNTNTKYKTSSTDTLKSNSSSGQHTTNAPLKTSLDLADIASSSDSDPEDQWPIVRETTPSWSATMWKWGVNVATTIQQQATAAFRSALGRPEPAPPSDRSSNSTPDSTAGWDVINKYREFGDGESH